MGKKLIFNPMTLDFQFVATTEFQPEVIDLQPSVAEKNSTGNVATVTGKFFTASTNFEFSDPNIVITNVTLVDSETVTITFDVGNVDGQFTLTAVGGLGAATLNVFANVLIPGFSASWVRISANVNVTNGAVNPALLSQGWNQGASFGTIPAGTDFVLSFQAVPGNNGQFTSGYAMFGVDNADPDVNYTTIDYAIYLQNGSNINIYENGANKGTVGTGISISDVFEIRRNGTTITYWKNGSLLYTSLTASTSAIVFDSSIYRYIGAQNVQISY